MAENTKIEWATHTFNPWIGCTKVAAGCANCYAEELMDKRYGKAEWGPMGTRVMTAPANWKLPLKWNREAEKTGKRARVFCASLADVFEDREDLIGMRENLFSLIDDTPHLDWLLLTKRPENIWRMWPLTNGTNDPVHIGSKSQFRKNVWLGTSVAEQKDADKNIPELLKCRQLSPVLFVSAEPLIGPVDFYLPIPYGEPGDYDQGHTFWNALTGFRTHKCGGWTDQPAKKLDWVIAGGESGPKARECHAEWILSIRDQCKAANVPCMIKQLGANFYYHDGVRKARLNDSKGGDWDEWSEEFRVREFPNLTASS
jgi:protein gp37